MASFLQFPSGGEMKHRPATEVYAELFSIDEDQVVRRQQLIAELQERLNSVSKECRR